MPCRAGRRGARACCGTTGGAALEVEVWQLPVGMLAGFVLGVPPPLALGTLILADGSAVRGLVVESHAVRDALDITQSGG